MINPCCGRDLQKAAKTVAVFDIVSYIFYWLKFRNYCHNQVNTYQIDSLFPHVKTLSRAYL